MVRLLGMSLYKTESEGCAFRSGGEINEALTKNVPIFFMSLVTIYPFQSYLIGHIGENP